MPPRPMHTQKSFSSALKTQKSRRTQVLSGRHCRRHPRSPRIHGPPVVFTGTQTVSFPRQFFEPVLQPTASLSQGMLAAAAVRSELRTAPSALRPHFISAVEFCSPYSKWMAAPLPRLQHQFARSLQRTKKYLSSFARTIPRKRIMTTFNCTTENSAEVQPQDQNRTIV